jgi:hypothetical protein
MLSKNPDDLTYKEKVTIGLDTIKSFFDSLGPDDIYKQIVLEELMKFLVGETKDK